MGVIISESWDKILQSQFSEPYIMGIQAKLKEDAGRLCPKVDDIWNAFKLCPFENTKVCLIGQDPYVDGSAHGLAFSSLRGYPPSLKVIFKELKMEFGAVRESTNLTDWAEQGVLLLNSCLTTVKGTPGAHSNIGWQKLVGYVLMRLTQDTKPKVFMFWGKDAKAMWQRYVMPYDNAKRHYCLTAIHPQAENYGGSQFTFTGCNHFRKANEFLGENRRGRINWINNRAGEV